VLAVLVLAFLAINIVPTPWALHIGGGRGHGPQQLAVRSMAASGSACHAVAARASEPAPASLPA